MSLHRRKHVWTQERLQALLKLNFSLFIRTCDYFFQLIVDFRERVLLRERRRNYIVLNQTVELAKDECVFADTRTNDLMQSVELHESLNLSLLAFKLNVLMTVFFTYITHPEVFELLWVVRIDLFSKDFHENETMVGAIVRLEFFKEY